MAALVKAAEKEGHLNVITLPSNWANYGAIMADFTKKYGIKINDANPEGSSGQEITAVETLKGQSRAPDVVDVGTPFAVEGASSHLWAPYKVATWTNIPSNAKDANGDWYADYGGYVAIGYDPAKVKVAPTSFASLTNPAYKNMIGLNNSPTTAGAAFAAVYAAALANGGSFSNIEPGIKYFAHLKAIGNFVPTAIGGPTTVQNGTTPILIWWDYLLASEVKPVVPGFKIVIPSDASYASYYDQAISATAPDPAAARLWEEYLYSTVGQNLWLAGLRPPDRAAHAGLQRHRGQDRVRGTAPGPVWFADVPDPGPAGRGGERRHPELADASRRLADGRKHDPGRGPGGTRLRGPAQPGPRIAVAVGSGGWASCPSACTSPWAWPRPPSRSRSPRSRVPARAPSR